MELRTSSWIPYAISVAVYIGITFVTKHLLAWNLALIYFVTTIDLLPRLFRFVFHRGEVGTER